MASFGIKITYVITITIVKDCFDSIIINITVCYLSISV